MPGKPARFNLAGFLRRTARTKLRRQCCGVSAALQNLLGDYLANAFSLTVHPAWATSCERNKVHNRVEKEYTRPTGFRLSFSSLASKRFDDHPCTSFVSELRTYGADRITRITNNRTRSEVVVFAWKCFGLRDAKVEATSRDPL